MVSGKGDYLLLMLLLLLLLQLLLVTELMQLSCMRVHCLQIQIQRSKACQRHPTSSSTSYTSSHAHTATK